MIEGATDLASKRWPDEVVRGSEACVAVIEQTEFVRRDIWGAELRSSIHLCESLLLVMKRPLRCRRRLVACNVLGFGLQLCPTVPCAGLQAPGDP